MRDGDRRSGTTAGIGTPDTPDETTGAGSLRYPFRPVLALMVLVLLGLLATAGFKSYRDLDSAKGYERELLEKIAEAKDRIQALDGRIDSIRNDPAMLERLAREDLGLVHADDVVIVLPDSRRARPSVFRNASDLASQRRTGSDLASPHPGPPPAGASPP